MTESKPKRILILSANPLGTERLGLDVEYRTIDETLQKSQKSDRFQIRLSAAARAEDFQGEILNFKPHLVHFAGHGKKDLLALAGNDNKVRWIDQDAIVKLFELAATHIECVVLNACYSEFIAEAIGQHIDYVVGMENEIGDIAAVQFSRGFYSALFAGGFYPSAFQHGRAAIQLSGIPEHLTPKLKIREKARRQSYVAGCQTDIYLSFSDNEASWGKSLLNQLDNLMAQKLGGRNLYTIQSVSDSFMSRTFGVFKAGGCVYSGFIAELSQIAELSERG